ncbi:MAG: hypothetical protein ACK57G_07400 [Planctomycetota bacterium]
MMGRQAMKLLVLGTALFLAAGSMSVAQDRSHKDPVEWVDSSGKYTVKAHYRRLDGDSVVIRLKDGRDMRIPFDKLSPASVEQAKTMAGKKRANPSDGSSEGVTASSAPGSSGSSGSSAAAAVPALDNLDAKAFVDTIMAELKKNNIMVLWDAFPTKKQDEIEGLVTSFAKQVDPKTFDMVRRTRNTIFEIAKKQQQFILNNSVLPIPASEKAKFEKSYPAIIAMLESYLPSEFFDGKRLQQGQVRELLQAWSTNLIASAQELGKTLPEGDPIRAKLTGFAGIPYTVETTSNNEAKVTLQMPGPAGVQSVPLQLVPSDGRWLPKEMVIGWELVMGQARAGIAALKPEQMHQTVSGFLIFANAPIQSLKNSKTQEEFDKVLKELSDPFLQGMNAGMNRARQAQGAPPSKSPGSFREGEE